MLVTVNCLFIFILSNVEKDLPKIINILFKIMCPSYIFANYLL